MYVKTNKLAIFDLMHHSEVIFNVEIIYKNVAAISDSLPRDAKGALCKLPKVMDHLY